ncbi:SRPBCC domain-containing protein [Companilactobacillus mishanensis]|uniref:SRPBCC domain-containing protein n=1 Tax=Companilactobacillus mishanensis TaxID=2486008 RepID=A0A5P0ZGF7_9LACO|nr:SRPBCC domain-containing protein [Companilactobacillus mishanensis]MQS52065.1 SRPBCC domain-containing protein [Companilactobacillus mishanensis]
MNSINWPTQFLPGKTDNFVSNEKIISDISINDIWANLVDTSKWESYYDNASNIHIMEHEGSELAFGDRFKFHTFGFPIDAQVMELVEPGTDGVARISWHGWQKDASDPENNLDVYHAFLIETLSENRVRLLTQESQVGKPAAEMAGQTPNPMLNGHQAWLDGLVKASSK